MVVGINLNEKAMLVRLAMSQWTARKHDRKVTMKVQDIYHTDHDAGRYNKVLVALKAIKAIGRIANEARMYHYSRTAQWDDNGTRLLPSKIYLDYTKKMQVYKEQFEQEVKSFLEQYPSLVEDAKERLNGMFNAMDYPSIERLQQKYSFEVHVSPLADANDFRVSLQADEVKKIKKEITKQNKATTDEMMKELWERLYTPVKHMSEKLQDSKAVFRDSLINKLVDLCSILPKLNVMEDKKLEIMRSDIESKLCDFEPEKLRTDSNKRHKAAKEAKKIMDTMRGYMGSK